MKNTIIIIVVGILMFEFIEHVVFPLIWYIKDRKKRSVCGASGMFGKVGEIIHWQGSKGHILVNGELWRAVSKSPLSAGDKAVIQKVNGLTLSVTPFEKERFRV